MRRIISVLAIVAAMVMAIAAALASPVGFGPNSFAPGFAGGMNFGHCQSQLAKEPGPAQSAQDANPAIFTAGNETFGFVLFCPKAP